MQCPSCTNQNPDGALFCGYCKAVFRTVSPSAPVASREPPRPPPLQVAQPASTDRAPDAVKKSVAFRVALWREPGSLRIERRISLGGKLAAGVLTFWSSLFLLGGIGSFSIGRILVSGIFVALGIAMFRARLGVVLDGATRQAREYTHYFRRSERDAKLIGASDELTLADRQVGASAGGVAPMVSRMILGSKVFRVHIEGSSGKILLCELSDQREAVELAQEVAKLFQIKVRDEGSWYVHQR
jgi:hypothetical protein